jgi:cell division septum initiation protein DivIVA
MRVPELSVGREPPPAAIGDRSSSKTSASSTPARAERQLPAGSRVSCSSALRCNTDLGLALFTTLSAVHCARLDLLVGDLATAEQELNRGSEALASSEESHLLTLIFELRAELVHVGGRSGEIGEIPRAADGLPLSDALAAGPSCPSVPRSDLDWREQADEAEWRAREALELARLGAAMARLSSSHARSAGGDGESRATERCAWKARRAVVLAPGLARVAVLREILANGDLPDGNARELALELLDVPDEMWGAKTTIDPVNASCWWYRSLTPGRLAGSGSPRNMSIGSGRFGIRHTQPVTSDKAPEAGQEQTKQLPPLEEGGGMPQLRTQVPAAIRNVSFPGAARGYERRAVDSYVNQVNRLIAELEVSRSPQAAVRHALDRVGEQTKALLQQARETAEEITAGAREEAEAEVTRAKAEAKEISATASAAGAEAEEIVAGAKVEAEGIMTGAKTQAENTIAAARTEADDLVARAHAEAEEVLERSRAEAAERLQRLEEEIAAARTQAEARMEELHAETEAVWKERHELLDELHLMGTRLLEVASRAAARASPAEVSNETTPGAAASEAESAQA